MRKLIPLLGLFLLLLCPAKAQAALSVVHACAATTTAATAITLNLTTATGCAAATAGNLTTVIINEGVNNTSTVSCTDSASQSWSQAAAGYFSAGNLTSNHNLILYFPNTAAITTVTCTWTGGLSTNIRITYLEIAGAVSSSPEDSSVNSVGTTSTLSLTSGSLTTTNANDILIFATEVSADQASGFTAGSGYTIPANGFNVRQQMEYQIVSATQAGVTTSVSWTNTSTTSGGTFIAFKAPASTTGTFEEDVWLVSPGATGFDTVTTIWALLYGVMLGAAVHARRTRRERECKSFITSF